MRAVECSMEAAKPILHKVFRKKANPHGLSSLDELLRGSRCFHVLDDHDQVIAAYALQGQGSEIWVQAAAGSASMDLCDLLDDLIPRHGPAFRSVGFHTHRRGLRKKAEDRGYSVIDDSDGYTMRKIFV